MKLLLLLSYCLRFRSHSYLLLLRLLSFSLFLSLNLCPLHISPCFVRLFLCAPPLFCTTLPYLSLSHTKRQIPLADQSRRHQLLLMVAIRRRGRNDRFDVFVRREFSMRIAAIIAINTRARALKLPAHEACELMLIHARAHAFALRKPQTRHLFRSFVCQPILLRHCDVHPLLQLLLLHAVLRLSRITLLLPLLVKLLGLQQPALLPHTHDNICFLAQLLE